MTSIANQQQAMAAHHAYVERLRKEGTRLVNDVCFYQTFKYWATSWKRFDTGLRLHLLSTTSRAALTPQLH